MTLSNDLLHGMEREPLPEIQAPRWYERIWLKLWLLSKRPLKGIVAEVALTMIVFVILVLAAHFLNLDLHVAAGP